MTLRGTGGEAMTNERPVLNQINLVVKDMDAIVTFYRSLGLEIPDTDPGWQAHHRTAAMPEGLDLDLDSDEFAQKWNRGWRSRGKGAMGVLGSAGFMSPRMTASFCCGLRIPCGA